jgi:superoxide dismutase, Cu-Zn family
VHATRRPQSPVERRPEVDLRAIVGEAARAAATLDRDQLSLYGGAMKLADVAFILAILLPADALADSGKVIVKLADAKGGDVGTATLTTFHVDGAPRDVSIALDLHGLTPGQHAIHVHQTAKCDAPDFKSAGGHFNPDNRHHGMSNPQGAHAGDMPNFTVDAKGNAKATVVAPSRSETMRTRCSPAAAPRS